MQFGYPYLIRLSFFEIQSDPVLNCKIWLDHDPETGSFLTLLFATFLTQKRAVFPAFSSCEVTLGQMRKVGIHFIIYHLSPSDSLTRVNDSTWVTNFGDSVSTRFTLRTMVTPHESIHFFPKMTRLRSESFFQNLWASDGQTLFVCTQRNKTNSIFASGMIKIDTNLVCWLSSRAMLHFEDQIFPPCTEVDLRLCFSLRDQKDTV